VVELELVVVAVVADRAAVPEEGRAPAVEAVQEQVERVVVPVGVREVAREDLARVD
jgi:hypothetical protein